MRSAPESRGRPGGIAANIREHYPAWLLQPIVVLLVVANTINIGADLDAMVDAAVPKGAAGYFSMGLIPALCCRHLVKPGNERA